MRSCIDFLMVSFPNYLIILPDPIVLFLTKNLPYTIYLYVYCLLLTPHQSWGLTQTSSFSISILISHQKQGPLPLPLSNLINQQIPPNLHWPPALQLTEPSSIIWNVRQSLLLTDSAYPLLLQPNSCSNCSMNIFKMQIWSLHNSKPVNGFPPHSELSSQALPWLIFVKSGSPAFPTLPLASLHFVLCVLIPLVILFFQYVTTHTSPHTWV